MEKAFTTERTENTEKKKPKQTETLCGLPYFNDALFERASGEFGLFFVYEERRRNANRILAGAKEENAFLECEVHNGFAQVSRALFGFLIAHDLDADHQSFAAHVTDDPMPGGPVRHPREEKLPDAARVLDILRLEQIHRGKRRRDAHWIAAKRRSVRARLPVHDARPRNRRRKRHARGNTLGHAYNVWLDPCVLAGPPFSGPAHAALHFVADEKDSVLPADPLQLDKEFLRRGNVSALALNRLDKNRGHFLRIGQTLENFTF